MKNIKTKRFVKLVSLALMVACLLSATILPSFAANGSYYNTKTYTLNGTRGYCESNFAYNAGDNSIMRAETKVVAGQAATVSSIFYAGTTSEEQTVIITREDNSTSTGGTTMSISCILDADDDQAFLFWEDAYGDIVHEIGTAVRCHYRGFWESFEAGWKEAILIDPTGLDS